MTRKIYKSAMGKTVDLGALLLQNEQVRAVGNMNVNARGDVIDGVNRVIDQKNRQVQRHYRKQTNVQDTPVATGTIEARQSARPAPVVVQDTFDDLLLDEMELTPAPTTLPASQLEQSATNTRGGLAAAIARNRAVKQELEKTRQQQLQNQPVRKI
jgi:hypothetical protein